MSRALGNGGISTVLLNLIIAVNNKKKGEGKTMTLSMRMALETVEKKAQNITKEELLFYLQVLLDNTRDKEVERFLEGALQRVWEEWSQGEVQA